MTQPARTRRARDRVALYFDLGNGAHELARERTRLQKSVRCVAYVGMVWFAVDGGARWLAAQLDHHLLAAVAAIIAVWTFVAALVDRVLWGFQARGRKRSR